MLWIHVYGRKGLVTRCRRDAQHQRTRRLSPCCMSGYGGRLLLSRGRCSTAVGNTVLGLLVSYVGSLAASDGGIRDLAAWYCWECDGVCMALVFVVW